MQMHEYINILSTCGCPNCGAEPRVVPKPPNPVAGLVPNEEPKLLPAPNDGAPKVLEPRVLVPNVGAALPNVGAPVPNVGPVPNVVGPKDVFPKPKDKYKVCLKNCAYYNRYTVTCLDTNPNNM